MIEAIGWLVPAVIAGCFAFVVGYAMAVAVGNVILRLFSKD